MEKNAESIGVKTLQKLLGAALLVYLAWLAANAIWFFVVDESQSVMVLSDTRGASIAKNGEPVREIADFHLFGKVGQRKQQVAPKVTEAPKTNLRLVLKGVFTAEQGGESGAIVEEIGKNADYYRIGDTLPGNAILDEVYSDRILINRNGRLETLSFEDISSHARSRIAKTVRPKSNSETAIVSPEAFVEEATKRLGEDPVSALRSVGLVPGEDGYVYQGNNPMLAGLNLEKGDVIRSVNGHNLGDIQKDRTLMKTLYEQGSLEVEVVRDGASFYVNYPLR